MATALGDAENTKTEREILLRVRHPFVVQMHYAFQTAVKLYMVMDFVSGGDLYFHLRRRRRDGPPERSRALRAGGAARHAPDDDGAPAARPAARQRFISTQQHHLHAAGVCTQQQL